MPANEDGGVEHMAAPDFICPSCNGALADGEESYRCEACSRTYPVLFGIPDFRLHGDRYLSLEAEREKAGKLHAFGATSSFADLVAYYYAITDDVPAELAARYQAYIQAGPERGKQILDGFGPTDSSDSLVDLGCGTGGLLVAAQGRFQTLVGVDIALRWLVICAKRFAELGISADLVCADIEALPFQKECFTHAVAADLVEHIDDTDGAVSTLSKQLKPGGHLYLSAANKFTLGPHPLVRVWGVGFMPRLIRRTVVKKIRGVDALRNARLISPFALARLCRSKGLDVMKLKPAQTQSLEAYPRFDRVLISIYVATLKIGFLRRLLLLIGPAFELYCHKISSEHEARERNEICDSA